MNVKQILQAQMDACFTNKNWFVSINDALQEISEEQAAYKDPNTDSHSVQELVVHLIFWNERYLDRFKGKPVIEINENNDYTFTTAVLGRKNMNWEKITAHLSAVLSGWQKALASASDEKLAETIPGGTDNWALTIAHIVMHNAYHLGQIVAIRKQYKTWDAKLGV